MEERRSAPRRANDADFERRLAGMENRMSDMENGYSRLSIAVKDWGKKTERNNEQTQEMYRAFSDAKAGFRTLELIGKGAKPVLMIFACASAILLGVKTGVWKWPF